MSYFPPPSEPDPEEEPFPPATADDATGPVPEVDEPTLVTGEPVQASDEPTQENAVVNAGEEPVFVDTSGRRRKILRRVSIGIAALAVAYLALFVVSLAGGPRPPGIPLPEAVAGDQDRTQTEPDGTAPGTPASGGSPAPTAGAGSGSAPAPPASPAPSAAPPGAAVPPAPAPAPAPPAATPAPTTPAPTPAPTTPASPSPAPALPSPLVTVPAPAVEPALP